MPSQWTGQCLPALPALGMEREEAALLYNLTPSCDLTACVPCLLDWRMGYLGTLQDKPGPTLALCLPLAVISGGGIRISGGGGGGYALCHCLPPCPQPAPAHLTPCILAFPALYLIIVALTVPLCMCVL